jgi:very-short-patch-repair endonuclease
LKQFEKFRSRSAKGKMKVKLTHFAKNLRKNSTVVEKLLWSRLRSKQLQGVKFRRQQPIENFIVDFVSFEKRIVIELDGGQHKMNKEKDNERDRFLAENGFTVLRFWDNDVSENLEGVLEAIRKKCL